MSMIRMLLVLATLVVQAGLAHAGVQPVPQGAEREYKTSNRTLADLPEQMGRRYVSLETRGELPKRVVRDDLGLTVPQLLYALRVLEGPSSMPVPPPLDQMLCGLNPETCAVRVGRWRHARGSMICLPAVEWVESIKTTNIAPPFPVDPIRAAVEVYGGCEANDRASCERYLNGLNGARKGGLAAIKGPMIVPVKSMVQVSMPSTTATMKCRFDRRAVTPLSVALGAEGWKRLERLAPDVVRKIDPKLRPPSQTTRDRGDALPPGGVRGLAAMLAPLTHAAPWTLALADPLHRAPNVLIVDWRIERGHCRVCALFNQCPTPLPEPCGEEQPIVDPSLSFKDVHGSHVVGLIAGTEIGVNRQARVRAIELAPHHDALDVAVVDELDRAIHDIASEGVPLDVVNLSLELGEPQERDAMRFRNRLKRPVTLFVAAAGDQNQDLDASCSVYPACFDERRPNLLVVGGSSGEPPDEKLWHADSLSGSAFGRERVHVLAPADGVLSATREHRTGRLSGTSQSAALVSGVASVVVMHNADFASAEAIASRLMTTARITEASLGVSRSGFLDAHAAADFAVQRFTFDDRAGQRVTKRGVIENLLRADGTSFNNDGTGIRIGFALGPDAGPGESNLLRFAQIHRLVRIREPDRYAVMWMDDGVERPTRYEGLRLWRDVAINDEFALQFREMVDGAPTGQKHVVPLSKLVDYVDCFSEDYRCARPQ